ncbi:MAG TPA: hypothetical protein VD978_15195 [Azospirillum sp.]|nr:hypothetical protein [Azospirillum sp.]
MGSAGPIPPPAPGTVPAAPSAAPVPLGEAVLQQVPERLQDLLRAIVLTGTVAGETPDGLVRVRTQMGDVLLKVLVPLPLDKAVTLQIAPGQPPERAILFANTPPANQAAPSQPPPLTGAQPGAAPPSVVLTLPSTPTALPPAAPTLSALPPGLLPGSIVPALVLAAAPKPVSPSQSTATSATSPAPAPRPDTTPGDAPAGAAPPPPAGPAGNAAPNVPVRPGGNAALPHGGPPPPPETPRVKPGAAPGTTPETTPATPPGTASAAPEGTARQPPATPAGNATPSVPARLGGDPAPPRGGPPPPAETPPEKPSAMPGAAPGTISDAMPDAPPAPPQAASTPGRLPVLAQGSTVALKIVAVTLPGTDAAKAPDMPPAEPDGSDSAVVHGTVAGATPQGQPILATRHGMLVLTTQGTLPPGTRVTAALSDPAAALHVPVPPDGAPTGGKDWPTLHQTMAAIAAANPELARTLADTVLPQPNRKLAAALTFLLSAMRGGDVRGWLGEEAVSTLERTGQTGLLKRLEEEFRGTQRQAAEPMQGDWRPFTVPMFDGPAPHPIHVHIRPVRGDEERADAAEHDGRGSRFLIDLELSRFGPLQLDGLVRPRRFDLILRSHAPLPPELRAELTDVFADSVSTVGYAGTLSFQTGARTWVKLTRAGRAGLGVTA